MKDKFSHQVKVIAFLMMASNSQAAIIATVDGAKFDLKEGVLVVDKTALERLRELLIDQEGLRLKPYHCPSGKLTIGVGRNLDDVGISEREALILLDNDIKRVLLEAQRSFPFFDKLTAPRQVVVLSMIFNIGITGVLEFKKMIVALEKEDYNQSCVEMLNSKWAKQVGSRASELARLMKLGRF